MDLQYRLLVAPPEERQKNEGHQDEGFNMQHNNRLRRVVEGKGLLLLWKRLRYKIFYLI